MFNTKLTSLNSVSKDLNEVHDPDTPLWLNGYNFKNAPWTLASVVEYIPYSESYGLQRITAVQSTNLSGKAAISHASTDGSNGMGNNVYYGHVKLSNEYVIPVGGALEGTAASQHALYNAYSGINNAVIAINDHIKNHFYGTAIIDASVDKKGFNYTLGLDNTYIVTCTKGTNENETAVWILNTRNNTIVVTTLKSVSGISYMRGNMVFGVYCDKGIIGESCCFKMS